MPTPPSARPVTDLRKGRLDDVDQPVGDIGGGDGATVRELRSSGDGAFLQVQPDTAEGAGIARHRRVQRVEDTGDGGGGGTGLALVQAAIDIVDVVGQIHVDHAVVGINPDLHIQRNTLRQQIAVGVMGTGVLQGRFRQLGDGLGHPLLRIVEPVADEGLDGLLAVFLAEFLQAAFADPGRADACQIVTVPLSRHADAGPAHAHHVIDVGVVALDADSREDQGAFLILVLGAGHVGSGQRIADVGLMRLGNGCEQVLAFEEHGHQEGMVRRMGIAGIWIVVQVAVAFTDIIIEVRHGLGLHVAAKDVDRQTLSRGEQLVVAGTDGATEIPRAVDDRGSRRPKQGVGHFPDDPVNAVGDDGSHVGIEFLVLGFSHGRDSFQATSRR
ncbi:MAG: hypothetical protein P1U37_07630 [Minwuia sp.]|nr:hypothetical protein [Minwuia sp.]